VLFLDDPHGCHVHLIHHEQPEMPNEKIPYLGLGDLWTRNVESELVGTQPSAVEECQVRIDNCSVVRHAAILPTFRIPNPLCPAVDRWRG
jgi:hypothetical protein